MCGVFIRLFYLLFCLVYKDGKVCISILHEAKADEFNTQEKMSEKWRPILGPEAVLVSVLSMLSDPNFESPANIDASVRGGDGGDAEGRVGDRYAPSRLQSSVAVLTLFVLSTCVRWRLFVLLQVEAKNDPKAYKARVRKLVRDSLDSL